MNPPNFFAELKRRNVYKVAVAYPAAAWLSIQAASILFPTFEAPGWVSKVFVAIVAGGFPIRVNSGLGGKLRPEGIKRTEDLNRTSKQSSRNRAWIYVVIIAGAIS